MKKFLFLILLAVNCSLSSAEDITITTYYPSPNGSYDQLAANKLAVDVNGVAVPAEYAAMQNGDAHIGRSLIIGSNASGYSYNGGATTADGTLLVKGNVGIGTTNPATKLQVIGLSQFAGNSAFSASNAVEIGNDVFLADLDTANTMGVYGAQNSRIGSIKLGSGGGIVSGKNSNIGIGTTDPRRTLHVQGSAVIASAARAGKLDLGTDAFNYIRSDSNGLYLGSYCFGGAGGCDSVAVRNGTGNVGIGTNAPAAKLDVQGGTIRGRFNCRQVGAWGAGDGLPAFVTCPAGTWLLTGGGYCQNGGVPYNLGFIHYSMPSLALNRWEVDCYGTNSLAGGTINSDTWAYATAICCDG